MEPSQSRSPSSLRLTDRVETMSALSNHYRTIVAWKLAFGTSAFKVDSADATGIVSIFGQIPLPLGDCTE